MLTLPGALRAEANGPAEPTPALDMTTEAAPPWRELAKLDLRGREPSGDAFFDRELDETPYGPLPLLAADDVDDLRSGAIDHLPEAERWLSIAAQPGGLRANVQILRDWDAVFEGEGPRADARSGVLLGVCHRMNDSFTLGFGYQWTDLTEGFRDPAADHWLLSVIAEF